MGNTITKPITMFRAVGPDAPDLEPLFEFDEVLSGDPKQSGYFAEVDPENKFLTGIWACQPGKYVVDPYYADCFEFAHILEGKVTITDRAGNSRTYVSGDAIVTPKGFKGTWEVVEPVRKIFAIYKTP